MKKKIPQSLIDIGLRAGATPLQAKLAATAAHLGIDFNAPSEDDRTRREQIVELRRSAHRNAMDPATVDKLLCQTFAMSLSQLRALEGDEDDDDGKGDSDDDTDGSSGPHRERQLRSSQKNDGVDPNTDESKKARRSAHKKAGEEPAEARRLSELSDDALDNECSDDTDDDDDDRKDDDDDDDDGGSTAAVMQPGTRRFVDVPRPAKAAKPQAKPAKSKWPTASMLAQMPSHLAMGWRARMARAKASA